MASDIFLYIRQLPTPVLAVDQRLNVVGGSRALQALFNLRFYPADNERNRQVMETWLGDKQDLCSALRDVLPRAAKSSSVEKLQWQYSDRYLRLAVTAVTGVDPAVYFVCFEDYSEQIAIEHSNAQARSYLESIMSSLYLGIIVTDRDMHITNMNRTQAMFLQQNARPVPLVQAIGMRMEELLFDEQELLDRIRKDVLEEGLVYGGITEHAGSELGGKIFSVSFFPLRNEHNAIVGIIRVCEDITEKTKLEAELRQAEVQALEIETIGKVIITLNHEINNALMVVIGNAEVLLRIGKGVDENRRDLLRGILTQAEKITSVTQQLSSMQSFQSVDYIRNGPQMIAVNNNHPGDPKAPPASE